MSEGQKSFYELLGVEPTADRSEIKKAHMRLSRAYHPDSAEDGKGDSELFKEVQEAWKILGDETAREDYDLSRVKKAAPTPEARPRSAQKTSPYGDSQNHPPRRSERRHTAQPRSRYDAGPPPVRRPPRIVRPHDEPPIRHTAIHEESVTEEAPVRLAQSKPERKTYKSWRDNIPESYSVRFIPSMYTRMAPILVVVWSLIPVMLGIKSALTLDSDSLPADILQPIGPFLLIGAAVVYTVGSLISLLSSTRLKALQCSIVSTILIAPLLFLQGNVLILTAIAMVLFLAAGYLTDRAIMKNTHVPDYLPTVTKKDIRGSVAWGAITPDNASMGTYPTLTMLQERLEHMASIQRNIRLSYSVTTPRFRNSTNPMAENVPRTPIIMMAGNRVAVIDVLTVQPSRVEIDTSNFLLINGVRTAPVSVFEQVRDGWAAHLGTHYEVEAFVVLDSDGPIEVGPSNSVRLTTLDDACDDIGAYLSYNYTDVDYNLVQAVIPYTETEPAE